MQRLMIVDDEPEILNPLQSMLEAEGYRIDAFGSPLKAISHLKRNEIALAICDIKMPEMSGYDLLKELRVIKSNLPVIFLSSKDEEQDQIIGFTLGADDYVTKPFSKHLLLARVAAVLRRHVDGSVKDKSSQIIAGDLVIDQSRHLVSWKEVPIDLTVTECLLLADLAERPGLVKSRSQLMDAAYAGAIHVTDRTIDSHVRNIRQKLKSSDEECSIIATVHGLGYKLKAD